MEEILVVDKSPSGNIYYAGHDELEAFRTYKDRKRKGTITTIIRAKVKRPPKNSKIYFIMGYETIEKIK